MYFKIEIIIVGEVFWYDQYEAAITSRILVNNLKIYYQIMSCKSMSIQRLEDLKIHTM